MKQSSFDLNLSTKKTRKQELLAQMDRVVPWAALIDVIAPYYPEGNVADVVEGNSLLHVQEKDGFGDARAIEQSVQGNTEVTQILVQSRRASQRFPKQVKTPDALSNAHLPLVAQPAGHRYEACLPNPNDRRFLEKTLGPCVLGTGPTDQDAPCLQKCRSPKESPLQQQIVAVV